MLRLLEVAGTPANIFVDAEEPERVLDATAYTSRLEQALVQNYGQQVAADEDVFS